MNPTSSNTLLNYSLSTLPDPLQASPAEGNTIYAALSFVVSNGGTETVNVSEIQLVLPTGPLAQQLTNNANAILYNSSPAGQWNIRMTSDGVFTALSATGKPIQVSTTGIVFQLYNIPVNQQVGTVQLLVNETASSKTNPQQIRTAAFSIAKFPYGFFFGNFTAQVPMVQDNQTVSLIWQGSDQATYTMFWDNQSVDVTETRSWTSPALTNDTTFLLRASITSQNETVTRDLSATVIIANPEIHASSLQVTGISNLQGAVIIDKEASLTVNSDATINGNIQLNGNNAFLGHTTTGNTLVNGTLTACGEAQLNSATITAVAATSATAVDLTVNNSLNVTNSIKIGNWTIKQENGKLVFTDNASTFTMSGNSTLYCAGNAVATDNSPITVYSPKRNAYLNATDHFGGNANGWVASAYWMKNRPDSDSNLTLHLGNPY